MINCKVDEIHLLYKPLVEHNPKTRTFNIGRFLHLFPSLVNKIKLFNVLN